MFKNYFLVTIRNLRKNGFYSFINITGLSIGITCSILIFLWVSMRHPLISFCPSMIVFTRFGSMQNSMEESGSWTSVPLPTYEGMKTADANIKRAVVTDWGGMHLLTVGENRLNKRGYYASEEFLEMFEFPLITGNAAQVMADPGLLLSLKRQQRHCLATKTLSTR